jgi:ATP/maltotriose-dependent transcriptional regulator MalT/CheY-like chemotaxis protein
MAKRERRPATILLVDDHPLVRKGLRVLLERERGLAVAGEAGDGSEALALARALAPDVVVLDVSMPGMNGFEAAPRILAASPGSKVVTLSMHRERSFVDAMLKAGAAAYVLKDSAPEDLVAAVRAALRGECFLSPPILGTVVSGYREAVEGAARSPFVLQTKLHRPALPTDLVPREAILARLEAGVDLPLTLVSAPAGYGKSVAIASWLSRSERRSTWLSLDAQDANLAQFLVDVVAAVRRVFPAACEETLRQATSPTAAPVGALAGTFINELDGLDAPIVLVLDDYHHIGPASPVNELIQQLLTRPPGRLHLVIVTRRDPPIPLALLRARGQVNEIRMRELRFDPAEARALIEASVRVPLSDDMLDQVERELEGWVAGLRLVALSLRNAEDAGALFDHLRGGVQHAQQYLTHEALAEQPPDVREWLLKTAVLDRFCASLCAAMCAPDAPDARARGEQFVKTLLDENLFVVPLDPEGEWFRYHPLFQELLIAELGRSSADVDIAGLHARAREWFDRRALRPQGERPTRAIGGAGRAIEDARAVGVRRTSEEAARAIVEALTNRELDILELLAERFQNKEIATRLSIAPETVNSHLKHLYHKLNVQSRRQAVTAATRLGLLPGRPVR